MSVSIHSVDSLRTLLELEQVKPDAFLGAGPNLGWGRIYGGQVVSQALRAAGLTVSASHRVHSFHAYFVRAGVETETVLYEVERVRDGKSFTTRQVVAYQAGGAVLNLIASFQADEEGEDVQSRLFPHATPSPDRLESMPTDLFFDHRFVRHGNDPSPRATSWLKVIGDLGDDPMVHACALAYLSDEDLLGVALLPHSLAGDWDSMMNASLDHAVWFHRPVRADQWLLFDLEGSGIANARGHAFARVFTADGLHVATVAQEGLGRERRE